MLVVPSSDLGPEIGLPNCWSAQRRSHVPTDKRWKISKIRLRSPPSISFPIYCPLITDIRRCTVWDITSSFHKPEINKRYLPSAARSLILRKKHRTRGQSIQWLGYEPGDWRIVHRLQATARDFYPFYRLEISLRSIQPPVRWVTEAFPRVKEDRARSWPPPSSAQTFKWNYITLSHMPPWRAMGNLTLYILQLSTNVLNSIVLFIHI